MLNQEIATLVPYLRNIDSNILSKNDLKVTETLLYGDSSYDDTKNTLIINATMEFLSLLTDSMCPLFR